MSICYVNVDAATVQVFYHLLSRCLSGTVTCNNGRSDTRGPAFSETQSGVRRLVTGCFDASRGGGGGADHVTQNVAGFMSVFMFFISVKR